MPLVQHPEKEPLWREEISVFQADERYVTRRQFAKFLTLTSLGMFIGNLWIWLRSWLHREPAYPTCTITGANSLAVGAVKIFQYPAPEDNCILVRIGTDDYAAYSQKCTHLSCAVYYERETNRLACPCHNGYFSVRDGSVLQGPPRRPLPRVLLERRGADLVAWGMKTGEES